ncbi:MAG: hypothetical protein OSJ28_08350 [Desulfovibrio sp.]|jgi:hypothetical protein|nr:hypothetical protein [Desulfovibrio sp.]
MKKPKSIASILASARESRSRFANVKNSLFSRLAFFRNDREKEKQAFLESDFGNVLSAWGIMGAENVPAVIFCLRLRLFALAALPLLYAVVAISGLTGKSLLVFSLVAIPCLFGILTTLWRIRVLKHSRFMPFSRWLMAGFGLWA